MSLYRRCARTADQPVTVVCQTIRNGIVTESGADHETHFSPSMIAGQFAHDQLRAQGRSTVDQHAIRQALDPLWPVRHHFCQASALGYAIGLGFLADRESAEL